MLIGANLDQVPDVEVPTKAGLYIQSILQCDVKDKIKDGQVQGQQLQVVLQNESGPDGQDIGLEKGKKLFDFIPLTDLTRIKRLALSAGLAREQISQGVDIALLPTRRVKTLVTNALGKGDNLGKTFANVRDYILPGEVNPAVPQTK